jgi:hypothetical protein
VWRVWRCYAMWLRSGAVRRSLPETASVQQLINLYAALEPPRACYRLSHRFVLLLNVIMACDDSH